MSAWKQTLEVARWEVARFFKWRDVVLSIAIIVAISATTWAVSAWQKSSRDKTRVAVISELALAAPSEFELLVRPAAEESELRDQVADGKLDGLVIVDAATARVVVRKEPAWLDDLAASINEAVRARRLADLGVDVQRVEAALAPMPLAIELTSGSHRGSAKLAALILVGLMLFTLFLGTAYLFTSITGEKQQRATEQLFTMTTAQVLIDGKLLGACAMGVISVVQMIAVSIVAWWAFSSSSLHIVASTLAGIEVVDAIALVGYTFAGIAFWMAVTSAVFATVDDPNTSARSSVLMLPFLPLSVAFVGLGSPDSSMMQVLSFVPVTSMTVVPARLVLGELGPATLVSGFALLVVATWLVRRAAARIYKAGMLMYGKEPSMREMLRWIRRAE
jgi:ABC-2 type transport system permease protein